MALVEVDDELRSLERAYFERLSRWQTEAIRKVADRVKMDGDLVLQSGLALYGTLPAMRDDLLTIRKRIATFGREQVLQELARQSGGSDAEA